MIDDSVMSAEVSEVSSDLDFQSNSAALMVFETYHPLRTLLIFKQRTQSTQRFRVHSCPPERSAIRHIRTGAFPRPARTGDATAQYPEASGPRYSICMPCPCQPVSS